MTEESIASERPILVFGDSHTDALKRAHAERGAPRNEHIRVVRYSVVKKGGKDLGDVPVEATGSIVAEAAANTVIASVMGGNQHQVFGLVQHPEPFDFIEPESPSSWDKQRTLIPYRSIWVTFEKGLRGKDGQRLTALREMAGRPIYHLAPPPPKESAEHILKKFETAFAEAGLATKGVTPGPIRLKIWRLQCAVLKYLCEQWDIRLLPPPDGTQTPEGFLKPEYYANDATHANASYGELVLQQLEMTAREAAAPVAGVA
jgi:hypothetical protein